MTEDFGEKLERDSRYGAGLARMVECVLSGMIVV